MKYVRTMVLAVLALSCARSGTRRNPPRSEHFDVPIPLEDCQQWASNQSMACTFRAEVVAVRRMPSPLKDKQSLRGCVFDADPKWEIELEVLPHSKKIAFEPGRQRCYVADVRNVFDMSPDGIEGVFEFTYTWNIDVPGRPGIEDFRARRCGGEEPAGTREAAPSRR